MSDDLSIPLSAVRYDAGDFPAACATLEEHGVVDHAENVESVTIRAALDEPLEVVDYTTFVDEGA